MSARTPLTHAARRGLGSGLVLFLFLAAPASGGTYLAFGPEEFVHGGGRSSQAARDFEATTPGSDFTLRLEAGHEGERPPTAVAVVLNGELVLSTHISRRRPLTLNRAVTLAASNRLEVRLTGRRGSVRIEIEGLDDEPPMILGHVTPGPNAAGWNAGPVIVSFDCDDDESGIASCTDPVAIATEGANQVVTGTAVDQAGNTASTAVAVSLDMTPPILMIDAPTDGSEAAQTPVGTSGFVSDALSGVAMANVDGVPLALANGEFEQPIALGPGLNVLHYRVEDLAGNSTSELVGVELVARRILLEALSPGDGTIQYNSGWPLILRLTMLDPQTRVGIDVYDFARSRSRATVPQAHDSGPFPRSGQAGVVLFEDPDGCPSFRSHTVLPFFDQRCFEFDYEDEQEELQVGEIVPCGGTCSDGTVMPACGTFQDSMRCPDETALRFRPGVGLGRMGLPALVLLADVGPGRRVEDGVLVADNLAQWDGVSYELRDGRGELSITAYLDIPFGLFAPVVAYDGSIDAPSPCDSDDACYTIDGGPLCPDDTEPLCDVLGPVEGGFSDGPDEPRIRNVYARVFAGKPLTLRAFVVDLRNPFDEAGVASLADENGDGFVDRLDAEAADWDLLSNEIVVRIDRRLYGNPCEDPDNVLARELFLFIDLDGNGEAIENDSPGDEFELFERCGGDDSSPVESPRPPP